MNLTVSYTCTSVWLRKAFFAVGASLALLLLCCLPAFSQGAFGTITGTISSAQGGPVNGAKVSVIDVGRGDTRALIADSSGLYNAPNLTPGVFTVRVEAMGFKTMEHTGLSLPTAGTLVVDFAMQPGTETEIVVVTATVLPANVSSLVDNKTVSETPTNGRSFNELVENKQSGQVSQPGGNGNGRTTNGLHPDQNVVMIEGVYESDITAGFQEVNGYGFQGGTDPNVLLPLDAIGEINSTPFPTAQYGYRVGNYSSIGIKSGTNNVHGVLYGFGRDYDTNTRNPFRPPPGSGLVGAGKSPFALVQWGGSLGGKLIKDKLFYFMNFEEQRYNVGATTVVNEPTSASFLTSTGTASTTNSFPDAIFDIEKNHIATPVTQLSLNLAGCGVGGPNGGLTAGPTGSAFTLSNGAGASGATLAPYCSGTAGLFRNTQPSSQTFAYGNPSFGGPEAGVGKVDYHFNSKNALNGVYYDGVARSIAFSKPSNGVSVQPYWLLDSFVQVQQIRGAWVWTPTSSIVNEARFGQSEMNEHTLNSDCQGIGNPPNYIDQFGFNSGTVLNDPLLGTPGPKTCAFPFTTITGFNTLNFSPGKGPYLSNPRNWIGLDNMSIIRGAHVLKFGVEIHRGVYTGVGFGGTGPYIIGSLSFGTTTAFSGSTPLEEFLTGTQSTDTVQTGTATTKDIEINYYAGFFQDTWHITRRFTADLGIRYEFAPGFSQAQNQLGFFNPKLPSGIGQETNGGPMWANDFWKHNFAPRIGLAWDVFGNGKTVVRSNFNIEYADETLTGSAGMETIPTGAAFYTPCGNGTFTGSACNNNGTAATTFQNPAGQNTINSGSVINSGLPWNDCSPAAVPGGCTAVGPVNQQSIFGALTGQSLRCGDDQLINTNLPVTTANTNPPPCALDAPAPNLYLPYVYSGQLGIQQAINKNLFLNISYVSDHEAGERGHFDINQPAPGSKNSGSSPGPTGRDAEQDRRPFTTNCPAGSIPGVVTGTALPISEQTTGPCFPWLSQVLEVTNSGVSNYNAFNFALSLRGYHGLTANFYYVLLNTMDLFSGNENTWTVGENFYNPQSMYANTSGSPQRINADFNYQIPGISKVPAQLLTGWSVNGSVQSIPTRLIGLLDGSSDISGTGGKVDPWNIVGAPQNIGGFGLIGNLSTVPCYGATGSSFAKAGCATSPVGSVGPGGICSTDAANVKLDPNGTTGGSTDTVTTGVAQLNAIGCYVSNGTVLLPPAQGSYGDMSRICCHEIGYFNFNLSITKTFGFLKEQRLKAQFRAEVFNLFNTVNYSGAGTNLGSVGTFGGFTATTNQTQGNLVTGQGGERQVQFGMKLIW